MLNAKASKFLAGFLCNQMIKEQAVWIGGEGEEEEVAEEVEEDTGRNAGVFPLFSALTLRVR